MLFLKENLSNNWQGNCSHLLPVTTSTSRPTSASRPTSLSLYHPSPRCRRICYCHQQILTVVLQGWDASRPVNGWRLPLSNFTQTTDRCGVGHPDIWQLLCFRSDVTCTWQLLTLLWCVIAYITQDDRPNVISVSPPHMPDFDQLLEEADDQLLERYLQVRCPCHPSRDDRAGLHDYNACYYPSRVPDTQ